MQHEIFYLVWREHGGIPTYKHPTAESAKQEAERLARQFSGMKFHVLACFGTVQLQYMQWTEMSIDRIPF
jgi:hypothetical protein